MKENKTLRRSELLFGIIALIGIIILITICTNGFSQEKYYCDPQKGSMSNDGSENSPWSSLEEVFKAGKKFETGDVICLKDGEHGFPVITDYNSGDVTITNDTGHNPVIERIKFTGATHWVLKGVNISTNGMRVPTDPPLEHPVYPIIGNSLVQIENSSSHITIDSCYICSVDDQTAWSKEDWNYKAWTGIYHTNTDHVTIRNCHIKNINFGIHNTTNNSVKNTLYEYNVIENFTGDGLRGHGMYTVIQYNTVKNAYEVNGNHIDMIQIVDETSGLILRGNKMFNYTDPNQPFRGSAQGIGFFSGMYYEFEIENNLIVTDHWNALTLMGAEDCEIINNTIIDPNTDSPGPAWIKITKSKNGEASSGNIVRNNITNTLQNDDDIGDVDNNITISYNQYKDYFVDPDNLDFRLKPGCPAIDAGMSKRAPKTDIDGNPRPQGDGVDIGAYEFVIDNTEEPIDTADTEQPVDTTDTSENTSSILLHGYNSIQVYPNPGKAGGTIHISGIQTNAEAIVKLFDMTGKAIFMQNIIPEGTKDNEFSFSSDILNRGMYILSVSQGNTTFHEKLIFME